MTAFLESHLGELAALVTALCWTLNAIAYEAAGKKIGSLAVSYIRLFFAFFLLTASVWVWRGLPLPVDASGKAWFWLLISGLVGFVLGDMFLFEAFVSIGSRISLLIMSAAPPLAALAGFILMGERLSLLNILGMLITMVGISLVILGKNPRAKGVSFIRPLRGIMFASLGAVGQALGLVFSKLGVGSYNPMAATQIRMIAAILAYTLIISLRKKWPEIRSAFRVKTAMRNLVIGSFLGPFIGVTLSLVALQHTATGIVSSITSLSPVLIIPLSITVFKEKVLPKEILGALVSIAGVVLLFF